MRDTLIRNTNEHASWVVDEFDHRAQFLPFNVSLAVYERNEMQGMIQHTDSYTLFEAIIVTIKKSSPSLDVEHLYKDADHPFKLGDIIVLAPNTLHSIPIASRFHRRSVIVVSF